jgi:LL-diaminopimelate aminotransferase
MDFFKDKIAARLGGAQFGDEQGVYKFERIKRLKRQAAVNFPDLRPIDMGVGEPDMPADRGIADVLRQECGLPENRFYADNGILEFQPAAAEYMQTIYGVKGLDPRKHILHGIGTKPIFAMLPLCLIDPGDISIVTVPAIRYSALIPDIWAARYSHCPCGPKTISIPISMKFPPKSESGASCCTSTIPTIHRAGGDARIFQSRCCLARTNNIAVVHDAAYASLTYDDAQPLSFLSADGALEVGVEVQSLSKAFNMTGWRLGFLAGNEKLVKACGTVKDNTDSGQFRAIQKAGIYALHHPELTLIVREKYSRRLNLLVETLRRSVFMLRSPKERFTAMFPYQRAQRAA